MMMKGFFIKKEAIPKDFLIKLQNEILENDTANKIGALTSFVGVVRSTSESEEKQVIRMEVEAWEEEGDSYLNTIVEDLILSTGIIDARLVHVHGHLNLGDPIVYLVLASSHRKEAFAALEPFIEAYKNKAPVWKKEIYSDGTTKWIRTAH
ncbi:MAG: molybdenum cofactor biosynthesis protein MoaE [Methanobacteriota archaeon]|nr:MAG: molybdenum cofactor biosynthesis protein MoaE [Euryarchaeota archaeon]